MSERLPILDNPRSDRIRGIAALGRRSVRRKGGELLVEAPQAVAELLRYRLETIKDIYFSEDLIRSDLYDLAVDAGLYAHVVTDQVARVVGDQTQGVFAVCGEAAVSGSLDSACVEPGPLVVLPETQDPGNAGTIIRAADAFGAAGVVACKGSVDLASPKVIRASAGSVFHLPVIMGLEFSDLVNEIDRPFYGAAGNGAELSQAELTVPHVWVFGNEARGLSDVDANRCTELFAVPMSGKAESLNVSVAAGICLYESQGARRAGS